MRELKIQAPAKINLTLRIKGKRDDGFHELETLMVAVPGLADTLSVSPAKEYSLSCSAEGVPLDESNLVTRAVRAFEKKTGIKCRYSIHLEKRVPHGAGLGGGSSDAASVLLALDHLEGTQLGKEVLSDLAAEFGSDTSFFIYQQPCWCRGRGECVTPTDLDLQGTVVLLKPSFGVSTPEAFKAYAQSVELADIPYGAQIFPWGELVNDLERPVFQKHLFLAEGKRWLLEQAGVHGAMMSGSGSTLFALVEDQTCGLAILENARKELDPHLWGYVGDISGQKTFLL